MVGQWALFTRLGVMCWCHMKSVMTFSCYRTPTRKILADDQGQTWRQPHVLLGRPCNLLGQEYPHEDLPCRSKASLRRFRSLGALGDGSGWDLRIRPPPSAGILRSGNFESTQFQKKIRLLKIVIRSAQNVGKVWISRKATKTYPFSFHTRPIFPRAKTCKTC